MKFCSTSYRCWSAGFEYETTTNYCIYQTTVFQAIIAGIAKTCQITLILDF